jgi:hypothetical protein
MKISFLVSLLSLGSLLVICIPTSISFSQPNSTYQNDSNSNTTIESRAAATASNSLTIPFAQSIYDTGVMSLPSSVKGVIIFIPDEAHHPSEDNKTISPKNPNYLPATLEIPEGTEIAFCMMTQITYINQ